jgi:hypothetical protein
MKKWRNKMRAIKNMRELRLMRQKLRVKEKLYEKELVGSTADVAENLTDKLRVLTFEFGMGLATKLITNIWRRKRKNKDENEENEH